MRNAFKIDGGTTTIFINSKGKVLEMLIDTADLEKAKKITGSWVATFSKITNSYYCIGRIGTNKWNWKMVGFHRYILDAPERMVVDHINHNTLDNRRCNLRIVDHSINQFNRKGLSKNNKSGARNVVWDKNRNQWRVVMRIRGKQVYLGWYDDFETAKKSCRRSN